MIVTEQDAGLTGVATSSARDKDQIVYGVETCVATQCTQSEGARHE